MQYDILQVTQLKYHEERHYLKIFHVENVEENNTNYSFSSNMPCEYDFNIAKHGEYIVKAKKH